MLPTHVRTDLNKLWDAFWPGNDNNPLGVIEFISYLLFVKQLDTRQAAMEAEAAVAGRPVANPIYTEDQQALRWSAFQQLPAESLRRLFTQEDGIFRFTQQYLEQHTPLGSFMQRSLSVVPTAGLLAKTIAMLSTLNDDEVKGGEVCEYLLSKPTASVTADVYPTPRHLVKLMVEMTKPVATDVVYDPAAGTGGLLIYAANYIKAYGETEEAETPSFSGSDSNATALRIAALNLLLHDIAEPRLYDGDALGEYMAAQPESATLLLSNLPASGRVNKEGVDASLLKAADTDKKEGLFLALLLKSLRTGGRAAVIVSERFLSEQHPACKGLRQRLLDKYRLQAVVSLPAGVLKPYADAPAAILFFCKPTTGATEQVWFYGLQSDGFSLDNHRYPLAKQDGTMVWPGDFGDIPDLLYRWKELGAEKMRNRTNKSFLVPAEEIRGNDYDLHLMRYKATPLTENRSPVEKNTVRPKAATKKVAVPSTREEAPLPLEPTATSSTEPFASAPPTATPAKQKRKEMPKLLVAWLLAVCVSGLATYAYISLKQPTTNVVSSVHKTPATVNTAAKENTAVKNESVVPNVVVRQSKFAGTVQPQQSIAKTARVTIPATTAVIKKSKEENVPLTAKAPSLRQLVAVKKTAPNENVFVAETDAATYAAKGQYKIRSKAYFHNEPDEATRRRAFVNHWNNSYATLNALEDKNGFIYVVFKNHLGQTSKGWLQKSDLREL